MTRIVAVYGGGGAKAAAHLGAERALREAALRPSGYVGCSMGAVVAAGLALGLEPETIEARMVELGHLRIAVVDPLIAFLGIRRPALLRQGPLREAFSALFGPARFGDMVHPCAITATDVDTGAIITYGTAAEDAPLVDVLVATCALPLYYTPVRINGRRVADGGLRAVVPLETALDLSPDKVVAVDVGPGYDEVEPARASPLPPLIAANQDALGILMAQVTLDRIALWRATPGRPPLTYVRPRVEKNATFATDRLKLYAAEGYRAAKEALGPSR